MKGNQIGYFFIVLASVIVVLAGIKSASEIVVPFLLSLFIAIILTPAYKKFNDKGLPSGVSLLLVMSVFILFLTLIAKLIGTSIHDFSLNIESYSQKLEVSIDLLNAFLISYSIHIPFNNLDTLISSKQFMTYTSLFIQSIGSLFSNGFVVLLSVIFMLLESKNFLAKIEYSEGMRESIVHIEHIFSKIKEYMFLKAMMSLLTGFIVWIALLFIGTDYAFLWAVLAFLLNFIPNIGSIIAAVPAVLITLVELGSLSMLMVVATYLSVNIIIGSILEPKVMGKGLDLSTLVVFLSLIFWGWLLGIVGMLLSIPLTIMVKIILYEDKQTRWISILLGSAESLQHKKEK